MDGEHLANEKHNSQGPLMAWDIQKVQKGKRPTLLEAEKANEIIQALNVLGNIQIILGDKTEALYLPDGITLSVGVAPKGFFEKEIEICEGGAVKTYKMLVKGPID